MMKGSSSPHRDKDGKGETVWTPEGVHGVIEEFSAWAHQHCRDRQESEKRQRDEALSKAAAARAASGEAPLSMGEEEPKKELTLDDFQEWIAFEQHYAANTLAKLRAQHARMRKSGRAKSADNAATTIFAQNISKLSPEGAAEMARARVAAAAAAEAMRGDDEEDAVKIVEKATQLPKPKSPMDLLPPSSVFDPVPYANMMFTRDTKDPLGLDVEPAQSTEEESSISSLGKHVTFTQETVFEHPKRQ